MKLTGQPYSSKKHLPFSSSSLLEKKKGWLLMEVIVALAIFSAAVVAFIVSLHQTTEVSLHAQKQSQVARLIEGAVMEASTKPEMMEEEYTDTIEELDLSIKVEVSPIELKNKEDVYLEDMWLIRATATWYEDGEEHVEIAETWRYGKMYQP